MKKKIKAFYVILMLIQGWEFLLLVSFVSWGHFGTCFQGPNYWDQIYDIAFDDLISILSYPPRILPIGKPSRLGILLTTKSSCLTLPTYAFKIFNLILCSSVLTVRLKTLTEWVLSTKLTLTCAIAFHNDSSLLCFFFSPPFGKQNNVSSSCLILRLKIENGLWIL